MDRKDFYIVGIGLSAGGQEPLLKLIALIPPYLNAAFVVLPHLSQNYQSSLDVIVRRVTRMPVIRLKEQELIRPGVVYILPESKMMTLESGYLKLRDRSPEEKMNYAINVFFESMAPEAGKTAIGVILSGANDDGTKGANSVYAHGGTILVQDPLTACFPRMPMEAINHDHPSEIKSPEELAQSLIRRIA